MARVDKPALLRRPFEMVGGDGVSLEEFLTQPVRYWVRR